jgi:ABC-type amino acid transport substrate-binding protein
MRNLVSLISNLKWDIVIACAVIAAIVAPGVMRPPDKTWEQIQHSGIVRFGMDPNYRPFEVLTVSGEFAGVDADLARELAQRLGLRAELVVVGSDGFYDALTAGRCDAIISALIPDPKRTWDFAYTTPYFDEGLVFVTPSASRWSNDLTGHTIAVEFGSEGDVRARWLARRTVGLRVLTRETSDEAMQAVEANLADASLTDTATARQYVAAHPTLRIGPRQTSSPYVIAVRKDASELLRALNQVLAQVQADGTLERILARWLDQ